MILYRALQYQTLPVVYILLALADNGIIILQVGPIASFTTDRVSTEGNAVENKYSARGLVLVFPQQINLPLI